MAEQVFVDSSGRYDVAEVDWSQALEIFEQYEDQDFSFTDCTSFALLQRLKIREVLAFDKHFLTMGFAQVAESPGSFSYPSFLWLHPHFCLADKARPVLPAPSPLAEEGRDEGACVAVSGNTCHGFLKEIVP